jgi:hypothetical protein
MVAKINLQNNINNNIVTGPLKALIASERPSPQEKTCLPFVGLPSKCRN